MDDFKGRVAVVTGAASGIGPDGIADLVLDAVRSETFYSVPVQPDIENALALRLEDIRLRRNPTLTPPL